MNPRIVEIRANVLKKNDEIARELRRAFADAGVLVVNLVSGPGAGKTALLEATLTRLRAEGLRVAALVGDLATDNDAARLARSGAPTQQISTGTTCHLEAEMVDAALSGWHLADLDVLFIENVGNLVCPASYDLGENLRAVLFAVTEGEDKPLKYPTIYNSADLALLTKMDLAEAARFDRDLALQNLERARPGMQVIETSVVTPGGIDAWIALLLQTTERIRAEASAENAHLDAATIAVPTEV